MHEFFFAIFSLKVFTFSIELTKINTKLQIINQTIRATFSSQKPEELEKTNEIFVQAVKDKFDFEMDLEEIATSHRSAKGIICEFIRR